MIKDKFFSAEEIKTGVWQITNCFNSHARMNTFCYLVEGKRGVDVRRGIFRVCAEKNLPILSIGAVGNDLESIFIRLVDRSDKEIDRK